MGRIFYALFFRDKKIQAHLDAIKYFCDPKQKTPAHITVRGPYRSPVNITHADRRIRGVALSILGPGFFFEKGQNTVFLHAGQSELRSAWRKPDFGFNPHITLFDGASREFARLLLNILRRHRLYFQCEVTDLKSIQSKKDQYTFDIGLDLTISLLEHVLNRDVVSGIGHMSVDERLKIIELLCDSLIRIAVTDLADKSDNQSMNEA